MTRYLRTAIALGLFCATAGVALKAQQSTSPAKPVVPLKVDVVLQRYQGDKRISSLPYSLIVDANDNGARSSLRVGVDVLTGRQTTNTVATQGLTTVTTESRNVGTNIDSSAETTADGRYRLYLSIQDSSIYEPDGAPKNAYPTAFRTLLVQNYLLVKDAQIIEFSVGTDKITGETLKAQVTATAIK